MSHNYLSFRKSPRSITGFVSLVFIVLYFVCFHAFPLCGTSAWAENAGDATAVIAGNSFPSDSEILDLSGIPSVQTEDIIEALSSFPRLKKIILSAQDADGKEAVGLLSFDDYKRLADAVPGIEFSYCFEMFGKTLSTDTTEKLEFIKLQDFTDAELDRLREIIPYLCALKSITVFRCGTTDEAMDKLRSDFPEIKIRWLVQFGKFSAWSDEEKIWAMAGLYHDEDAYNLKYFHDLKYLDLGHSGLTKCEFLYDMPDIEVLILAVGDMEDITPVGSLKHLEYLEICDSKVSDLSPLASCVTLEHLNLGGIPATDLTPLFSLTNLKRLFADNLSKLTDYERINYELAFQELLPDAQISFEMWPAGGTENGLWRYSRGAYTGSLVPRYALLVEQFGYGDDCNQAYVYDYYAE